MTEYFLSVFFFKDSIDEMATEKFKFYLTT